MNSVALVAEDISQVAVEEPTLDVFPCTPPQQRCWFLDQLEPGNPALNVAIRWELTGRFSRDSIERAFRMMIERHESFRTRFVELDSGPAQQPLPEAEFKLDVVDVGHLAGEGFDAQVMELCRREARRPFDLTQAPLVRATLFEIEPGRALLLIVIHQSVFDGWSIRVLGRDLGTTIDAVEAGRVPDLPDLPLQYADYALWLDEYYASAGFEAEQAYWLKRLQNLPYFEIQPDHPRAAERTTRGEIVSALLSPEVSDLFDGRARELGSTTFSLGSAIIAATLHRFSGGVRDVVFGTQVAGRPDVDLENLIGVFINNLVLRMDVADTASLKSLASQAHATVQDALINQRMPFHKLVELLNPPRDLSRTPLISINVIIQQAFLEDAVYGDLTLKGVPSPSPGALYDLNFQMIRRQDGWRMSLEYNADLFERSTAQDLLDLWRATFETCLASPELTFDKLPQPAARNLPPPPAAAPGAGDFAAAEAVLRAHPAVEEAAIFERDGRRLAAVTPRRDYAGALEALPEAVLEHAFANLSERAAPQMVSVVLSLPRRADGAVDKAALPSPAVRSVPRQAAPAAAPGGQHPAVADAEMRIAHVWRDVLGVTEVRSESNFFELGGHSLLAARMLARIAPILGYRPPISVLFKSPTLGGFTRAAAADPAASLDIGAVAAPQAKDWSIIDYGLSGAAPALIGINHPMLFYRLGHTMNGQRSVMDVQITDPTAEKFAGRTFEEIVGGCVAEIRAAQPQGPYALLGLCVNGTVALEAARQLTAQGETVAFVGLIDSWKPGYYRSRPRWQFEWWRVIDKARRAFHLVSRTATGKAPLSALLRSYDFTLNFMVKFAGWEGRSEEDVANGDVTDVLVEAARNYRPGPYAGKVVLFKSETSDERSVRHHFGWGGIVDPATPIVPIEGWHEDAFTANGLKTMAEVVQAELSGRAPARD